MTNYAEWLIDTAEILRVNVQNIKKIPFNMIFFLNIYFQYTYLLNV